MVMESEHTSGGRLRSSQFDMYLRADVLEDRLARLDQISNPRASLARREPLVPVRRQFHRLDRGHLRAEHVRGRRHRLRRGGRALGHQPRHSSRHRPHLRTAVRGLAQLPATQIHGTDTRRARARRARRPPNHPPGLQRGQPAFCAELRRRARQRRAARLSTGRRRDPGRRVHAGHRRGRARRQRPALGARQQSQRQLRRSVQPVLR